MPTSSPSPSASGIAAVAATETDAGGGGWAPEPPRPALVSGIREEDLTCAICYDVLSLEPVALPCSHTFCLACLEDWKRRGHGKKTHRCPMCDEPLPRELLVNVMLRCMVATFHEQRRRSSPSPVPSGAVASPVSIGSSPSSSPSPPADAAAAAVAPAVPPAPPRAVSDTRLFVRPLAKGVRKEKLRAHFEKWGKVTDVWTKKKGCFGFVTFARARDAAAAHAAADSHEFHGRALRVAFAEEKGGGRGRGRGRR